MTNDANAWLNATRDSMAEFCETTLAMEMRTDVDAPRLPDNLTGCFVALVGQDESLQVGLASDAAGCQTLARTLFASDDDLSDSDISDALGEIANILAGGVKKRMSESHGGMVLGLPIVMEGHVRLTERQQMAELDIALGEVPVRLLVVCSRE
jgi:CheY-specific phosphatase CheX